VLFFKALVREDRLALAKLPPMRARPFAETLAYGKDSICEQTYVHLLSRCVSMTPTLGIVAKGNIKGVKELSKQEYDEYTKAKTRLMLFSRDQRLFEVVRMNYYDLQNALKKYQEEYIQNPSMDFLRMESMYLDLNRLILNYLSTARAFVDQSRHNISTRCGEDSQRYKNFEKACSIAYDGCFSYRFLDKLRNYVQHCGMPLGKLSLRSWEIDPTSKKIGHELQVMFNRDELLAAKFDWTSRLKKELQEQSTEFEVMYHIGKMMKCIETINIATINEEMPELKSCAGYIVEFINPLKGMLGTPCILDLTDLTMDVGGNVNIEWIPLHLVKLFTKLT
jgi:hypothetical protein